MDHDTTPEGGWRANRHVLYGPLPAVELAGCALLFAVFWGYYEQARALPLPLNPIDIGAGGFPFILAIATLLAIVTVCVAAVVRAFVAVPVESVSIRRPVSVVCAVALLIAQATWFEAFGALPSVIAFAAGTAFACGERRIAHLVGVSVALAAFVYGAFVLALAVNLP